MWLALHDWIAGVQGESMCTVCGGGFDLPLDSRLALLYSS